MASLSHFDDSGNAVMVDVSGKTETTRIAIAEGYVFGAPETIELIANKGLSKGDVLSVAQLAGIMGAKQTPNLIPLCHPLPLSSVKLELTAETAKHAIHIKARVKVTGTTGVEMEALTAVSIAALTVYDMAKAVDKAMRIDGIRLLSKTGGKSGTYTAD